MPAPWEKSMKNQDSILKSRDITLPTKAHKVKSMVFPVVMYGCESWTIKKAEWRRTDAFGILWFWRRLLRVPWTARRSCWSVLKEINPEYSLERLMLKLKLQYFVHLMRRANSLEKTLVLRHTEGRRRRGWQDEMVGWHHWLNGHEFKQAPGDGEGQGRLVCCSLWGCKELDMTEQLTHSTGEKWREFPGQLSNSRSESHLQVEVVLFTKAQSARQVMLAFRSLFRMEILFFLFFLKGVPFSFVCLALIRTNSTC